MPGLKNPQPSSLDRLKALDSLPSLDAQLVEIQQLCTHGARAEMIARWLCGKLQSDASAQQSSSSWSSLTTTLRLLSPERVATILGGSKVLKTLQASIDSQEPDLELLRAGTRMLRLLLEQANAEGGVAVAAVLSLPAAEAAGFTGCLLEAARTALRQGQSDADNEMGEVVEIALRIWTLRKRSQDENEMFSQHCLAPCAALLASRKLQQTAQSEKKRQHDPNAARKSVQAHIESLLARHIFLPGRTAFFKARSSSSGRQVGSQRPSFTIEGLVGPLGKLCTGSEDARASYLIALPQLLEVALRSAPTPSPTQRSHEKPWTEALFSALHDINLDANDQLRDAGALSGLLAVLAQRSCTLSAGVLNIIVDKHAGLGGSASVDINWSLVAGVVEVDAGYFKDVEKARKMFDSITAASIKSGEDANDDSDDEAADNEHVNYFHVLLRDRIVVPVLKAFARFNDLTSALDLCFEQLKMDLHGSFWSVWNELDEPIQDILEDALLPGQVHTLCSRYCHSITAFNNDRDVKDIEELSASIIMLNAVLRGVSRDETFDKLHNDLEKTFSALMELHDVHVGPGLIPALKERRCWSLMTTIFELWCPRWASGQTNAAVVVTKIEELVPRSVLDRAVDLSSTVHPEVYASVEDYRSPADSRCFAVRVCTQMLAYRNTVGAESLARYVEVLDALGSQCRQEAEMARFAGQALTLEPQALAYMSAAPRQALLEAFRVKKGPNSSITPATIPYTIQVLASSTSLVDSSQAVDDIINSALAHLGESGDEEGETTSFAGTSSTDILMAFPAKGLARTQREEVLNAICDRSISKKGASIRLLTSCLPLMLRLMQLPNPTARLCLEPALVVDMARTLDESQGLETEPTAAYLEELVSLILQQCIRTKDQERSQKMLVGLSAEVASIIKSKLLSLNEQSSHQCGLVKAVYKGLETSALDSSKAQLVHRKSSAVKKLLGSVEKALDKDLQISSLGALTALDLLLAIPPVLIQDSSYEVVPMLANLATFLETAQTGPDDDLSHRAEGKDASPPAFKVTVRCYEVLGKLATTVNTRLASFADGLLGLPLEPQEHAAVLQTFGEMLAGLGESRAILVQELLEDKSTLPASRLLLVQLANGRLEKTDFDTDESPAPNAILHQLLKVVSTSKDLTTTRRALACVTDILKLKPFMVNQYTVEVTLQILHQLAHHSAAAGKNIIYLDICTATSTLLLHHRSRLQGRFHMLIKLFQSLLSRIFQPLSGWEDRENTIRPPTTKHAHSLSRLLKLFCEPPHLRSKTTTTPSLTDESRKEQAHVGTFVQHVLHHYCTQILHGTLGEGMKDALTPGLRAMVEAMEMGGKEGGKALSAAMGNAERAVLRGVYEEWRRFGRWKGG